MLHEAGRDALEAIWERELGVERYAELQADLTERDRRQREWDAQRESRQLDTLHPTPLARDLEATLETVEIETELELERDWDDAW